MASLSVATSAISACGLRLILLRLGLADLLGQRVALLLRLLERARSRRGASRRWRCRSAALRKAALAARQCGVERLGVGSDPVDVEHRRSPGWLRRCASRPILSWRLQSTRRQAPWREIALPSGPKGSRARRGGTSAGQDRSGRSDRAA